MIDATAWALSRAGGGARTAPLVRARRTRLHAWLLALLVGLILLIGAAPARAGIDVDVIRELRLLSQGITPPKRFGNVAFRVAVFSYEDPDNLGLDDTLAALVGHEILVGSRVSSLGMLRYVGRLTPQAEETLGYFDKVELLTRSQEPTVALWGLVRRQGDEVAIDTFLYIPASTQALSLQVRQHLPQAMGGGDLVARLGGDRLLLQHHTVPLADIPALQRAALSLKQLRAAPRPNAQAVTLPMQTVYSPLRTELDWVLIRAYPGNRQGWVPRSGHCSGTCAPLVDAPRFVSGLLAFIEKRRVPEAASSLSSDAQRLRDHLLFASVLDEAPPEIADREAIARVGRWLPRPGVSATQMPDADAATANLRLVARVAGELRRTRLAQGDPRDRAAYERIQLPPAFLRDVAYEAADALLLNPNDVDLLANLRRLYEAAGDTERATLAGRLLQRAAMMSRQQALPPPPQ